jgi:hypothetical protein
VSGLTDGTVAEYPNLGIFFWGLGMEIVISYIFPFWVMGILLRSCILPYIKKHPATSSAVRTYAISKYKFILTNCTFVTVVHAEAFEFDRVDRKYFSKILNRLTRFFIIYIYVNNTS